MTNFKNYFVTEINAIYNSLSSGPTPALPANYKINVVEEMTYGTEEEEKNTITIVLKFLVGSVLTSSVVYPIQLIVLSEPNDVEIARTIIDTFAKSKSMTSFSSNLVFYKQMYSTSTIMSNFNRTPDGMRSIIFVSGTLIVTENVKDIAYVTVKRSGALDSTLSTIKFTNFNIAYAGTLDSQKIAGQELNQSVKKMGSQIISLNFHNLSSNFVDDLFSISLGALSGNTYFEVKLYNQANVLITTLTNLVVVDYALMSTPNELPMVSVRLSK